MARKISDAELTRQIKREGMRWDLHPMVSQYGAVLVAEDIPAIIPLANGLFILERVRRDITAISQEYPWSHLLRNRKRKTERTAALRRELAVLSAQKKSKDRIQDVYAEMESDFRAADRGRLVFS